MAFTLGCSQGMNGRAIRTTVQKTKVQKAFIFWFLVVESRMLLKYFYVFLISMIPLIELRGAIPVATAWGLMGRDNIPQTVLVYAICIVGNMLPVPFIFFFARKVLEWGKDKPIIGYFFTFCLEKGEKGGQKLQEKLVVDSLLLCFCLLVSHFLELAHGQEHSPQVFLIWISNQVL